ncbi:tRNA (guanine-N(7)-)-methyltransferase non-catalytic subunit trm82 [Tulasnella sp. JGI-2019a]|nr:tRNA (guanine-N(7)-)-methyltransferase non-catalytic subunit trm82 [Tulasnella sp. JGI-2019a]
MSHYPIRHLWIGTAYGVTIAGSHIQIYSTGTGKVLTSTSTGAGPVRAADNVADCSKIVTTGDDKLLKVWHLTGEEEDVRLQLESTREIPKKSSEIHISADGTTILASDKFGDISAYPMEAPAPPEGTVTLAAAPEPPKVGRGSVEEKPRLGTLILGHTSVITAFTLTPSNEYIITGDRDEHIRVSWYPLGYNIERYCLGHKKYVSALHIPLFSEDTLISGGGDPELFVWNWTLGTLLHQIPVMDIVRPTVRVKGGRQSYKRLPRRPDGQGLSRKSRSAKKTKKAAQAAAAGSTPNDEDDDMDAEEGDDEGSQANAAADIEMAEERTEGVGKEASTSQLLLPHKFDPQEESFVIGKINSMSTGEADLVLFTAVGSSALFYFSLPSDTSAALPPMEIHVVDLGSPVLDYVVSAFNGRPVIWVSTDNTWSSRSDQEGDVIVDAPGSPMVRLVKWSDEKLIEVAAGDAPPLLSGINTASIKASPTEIAALELYAPLSMLPKSRQEEADDAGEETPIGNSDMQEDEEGSAPAKPLNRKAIKKIAGRANTKVRLEKAKEQGLVLVPGASSIAPVGGGTVAESSKRPRIDGETNM